MSTRTPDEDSYAAALLRPLAGEPTGEPRVDLLRAVGEGRRRRRVRWYSGAVAVAALTATAVAGGPLAVAALRGPAVRPVPTTVASPLPGVAGLPSTCTVERLPTGDLKKVVVTGGDPSGRWVLGASGTGNAEIRKLLIWRDGKLVGTPDKEHSLRDINADGVAVGSSNGPEQYPYVYRSGTFRRLPGGQGHAVAINKAGVITGVLGDGSNRRLVRWPSDTAPPVELRAPDGAQQVDPVDIDDDGTIIGWADLGKGSPDGYLWQPDGTPRALPLPTVGNARAERFEPTRIRNGWVVGSGWSKPAVDAITGANTSASGYFRYRIDSGRFERVPETVEPVLLVNGLGWVVGDGGTPTLFTGAEQLDLPRDAKVGRYASYTVSVLSDDGRTIVGHVDAMGAVRHPLWWRCR